MAADAAYDRPGMPQFDGAVVVVRNTFLDFRDEEEDGAPPMAGELRRARTAPPTGASTCPDPSRSTPQSAADGGDDAEKDNDEDDEDEECPPPPEPLLRTRTRESYGFEPAGHWNWADPFTQEQQQMQDQQQQQQQFQPQQQQQQQQQQLPQQNVVIMAPQQPQGGYQAPPMMMPQQQQPAMTYTNVPNMPVMMPVMMPAQPMQAGMMPQFMNPANPGMQWPMQGSEMMMNNGGPGPVVMTGQMQGFPGAPAAGTLTVSAVPGMDMMGTAGDREDGPPPQPHTLTRHASVNTVGKSRINWAVDARKLRGNDKQAVSPAFEVGLGNNFPNVIFKMMIYPVAVSDAKGGASFKKARGHGFVQLKCEAELTDNIAKVSYRISIGSGARQKPFKGPVVHDFARSAVSRLKKEDEEWDFNEVVDHEAMTFTVCLEIMPVQG
eukprot:TRINITY_DN1211_c3_g1_i1.p1 TRINITY_DN1211_c3_g1~~TRINITY_DN1211_c3_g1_i1.p1  ORF type:complete len:436 (+),score=116.09 TRINITY_DN1211_c3_g1_i1:154-1461(+)